MKLKKGQDKIKFGPGEFAQAVIVEGNTCRRLMQVSIEDFTRFTQMHQGLLGVPCYITVVGPGSAYIFPAAAGVMELRVRWTTWHEK